ncbi:phosphate starvation-inducible protein PhoH [Legionella jamestowniensis]|uniref:PhoH-like protein n=1 Tax=Legionella jamestowniensis TaxID=455 RepID=A0ABX2XW80_9GAMM|nr:PhoH family protein [Legionella jamestowniensis]OCH98713.1 phosphate starvation-inducible protein PhoH [Legionella jamestowniensis]
MSSKLQNETLNYSHLNSQQLANLCGAFHENIKLIELFFNINVKIGHDEVRLFGYSHPGLLKAKQVIKQLHKLADKPIQAETVNSFLENKDPQTVMSQSIKLNRKTILPRNAKQADYLNSISKHDITFAVGPAGTGKTYLAVSKAIEAFEKGEVQRLVFVRPAVEAGEKLGFLPGDLVEKVLPYLRPIYDALYEMIGFKEAQKLIQTDVIEVLPLAFMRGRTLNEAFIILDEAQNTTVAQMKMFLTRMGFGSKTVITGDVTQIDLPKGTESGLNHAVKVLDDIPEISVHYFTSREVVRHPLVSRIIDSYEGMNKDNKE